MLARLILVVLLLALPLSAAAPDPTAPGAANWAQGRLDLDQPSLTRVDVSGELLLHKHLVGASSLTAAQMSQRYAQDGAAFTSLLEATLRASLVEMLERSFPGATVQVARVDADEASLTAARVDAFDPPVRVLVEARVDRTSEEVGLAGVSDAALQAAFDSGAVVQSTMALALPPGYALDLAVHAPDAPDGLVFAGALGGTLSDDGREVAFSADNTAGTAMLSTPLTMRLRSADARAPDAETFETLVDISLGALRSGSATLPVVARVETTFSSLDVPGRFPGVLPPAVLLDHVSADGLRALWQSGAIDRADLVKADDAYLDSLAAELSRPLGQAVSVRGGLDHATLDAVPARPYDGAPPVRFTAEATGEYPLPGSRAADADLALDIGASLRLEFALVGGRGETTYVLHPPPGTEFLDPQGATVSADGRAATIRIPAGGDVAEVALTLRQAGAVPYDVEEAEVSIVVDLKDLDVSLGRALGGDLGTVLMDITVTAEMRVIRAPAAMRGSIGDDVELEFLTSDAIRLLVARGYVTPEQLADLEATLLAEMKAKLSGALGSDAQVTGGFVMDTLSPAHVSTPSSGDVPLVFEARASLERPLSSGGEAAISLYSVPQTFTLPRLQGLDTTYVVVLPRGLDVTDLVTSGGEKLIGEWHDGRRTFTVRPSDDAVTATVTMSVTPTFVMVKFWPLVLVATVVLVLVVGAPIALLRLRRKSG